MIKLKDHHRTTIPFASVNRKWCWIVSVRYCGHLSGIPADLTGFRLIYQPPCFLWGERSIELYSIKVSLKAPPFPWHVGAAVKRVIVTPCPRLERTHRPNCLCHRPCLAVKYWAWRHRPSRREASVLWERGWEGMLTWREGGSCWEWWICSDRYILFPW